MRSTKTVSISMTPAELEDARRLAKISNRSLSGLFREALNRLKHDQYWQEVHGFAQPRAQALGLSEDEVVRLVHQYRQERRDRNSSKKRK